MTVTARPSLRRRVLALFATLLLAGGLVHSTLDLRNERAAAAQAARRSLEAAAEAARAAPDNLARDRAQASAYAHMRTIGFLGGEQRAAWIGALAAARAGLGLEDLSWRLSPQAESGLMPGLRISAMDISTGNLDLAGLDTLFARLRGESVGFFTVERCSLQFPAEPPRAHAECRLLWWTWPEDGDAR